MRRGSKSIQPQILGEFLENYTVPALRSLAKLVASGLPTRKAELVAVIRAKLEDPGELRHLWESLDPLQQAAVSEAIHASDPHFDAAGFRAKYGQNPNWGRVNRWGRVEDPSLLCLFIYDGLVPLDLKGRLKVFVSPPRAARVHALDEPPDVVERFGWDYTGREPEMRTAQVPVLRLETERAAQHDVHAVLRLIDAGKVRASAKTKRVSAAGAKVITAILQGGDFYEPEEADDWHTAPGAIKAFAWPLIVQSAGLANLSGNKLQLTSAGKKALTQPAHQVIRRCWERWLKTKLLDEFNRVHTIKGQTGKGKRSMTTVPGRRAAIVQAMKACPADAWIAIDEFSRFMRAAGHTFAVSRDLWSLYITDPHYGSLGYEGYGEWHIVQERYIMAFLFEYAATLGLIDVAYVHPSGARGDYGGMWGTDDLDCLSRYDGLLSFCINGLGAWCLGSEEAYVPSLLDTEQVLQVLPNLDVVATVPLQPGDVLFLEQFTEPVSDAVWKIERTKLLQALEEGHLVGDIEAFLKAKAGGHLPDNVVIFFREVAERASQLTDRGSARLIEAQDAFLAQLIANDSRLRSLCMLAGERHIVVPVDAERAFRRALRELGYGLPVSQDGRP